ncbi:MAG: hypothetical protein H7317_01480, partial [Pseudorhodobacter sp.]|nr:hypothetical protein [Pseudorhodobacter sp.]
TSTAPAQLSLTADADTYDGTGTVAPVATNKWCPPQPGNIIRLPAQNITTLQGQINGLVAVGATSINAGLKWGLGLLDPGSRPIYSALIAGGSIPSALQGRPFDYEDKEAMKVIVLMTDGEHFAEERVNDPYKSDFAPIFKGNTDSNYAIFHAIKVNNSTPTTLCASKPYYIPHLNVWHVRPWMGTAPVSTDCYVPITTLAPAVGVTQQTWPQVWQAKNMQYVACSWYITPLGQGTCSTGTNYNTLLNLWRTKTLTTDMDNQLQTLCTAAKSKNVIIYGIAFEATTSGQTQIRNCSTDGENGSHYFNAQGLQIATAFSAIANNISQLRLTQ